MKLLQKNNYVFRSAIYLSIALLYENKTRIEKGSKCIGTKNSGFPHVFTKKLFGRQWVTIHTSEEILIILPQLIL